MFFQKVNVCEKNEKTSQYKGVYWHTENRKWRVMLRFNGQKQTYGGMFKEELDAAKKATQLCEEFGIQQQKPTISVIPNQKFQVTTKLVSFVSWYCGKSELCKFIFSIFSQIVFPEPQTMYQFQHSYIFSFPRTEN